MTRQALYCLSLLAAGLLFLVSQTWAEQGDPLRGEALYVGTVGFAAGGAPCLACHGIAGHELGHAAGASYGPDLSAIYEDYGEEGVAGVLDELSFESMVAIYADRPLTDTEKADLTAFFGSVSKDAVQGIDAQLSIHVLSATAFFMLVIGALGWRRMQGVRQPLLDKARHGKGGLS